MLGLKLLSSASRGASPPPGSGQLGRGSSGNVWPILQSKFEERNGVISPDGRWLAYESDGSGRPEIYVRPLPNTEAGQWQVSTAGGTRPVWARSAKELFFLGMDTALMRASVEATDATWNGSTPQELFRGSYFTGGLNLGRTYDIAPDGPRFLMI